MTREQTLRLAKAVKKVSEATNELTELAQEMIFAEPKTGLGISGPTFQIATANALLLEVTKEHSKQYLQHG